MTRPTRDKQGRFRSLKKPQSRRPLTKKPIVRKPLTKKPLPRRPPAKKPVGRKPPAKKPLPRRTPAKKPVVRKPPAKKPLPRRPPAKKPVITQNKPSMMTSGRINSDSIAIKDNELLSSSSPWTILLLRMFDTANRIGETKTASHNSKLTFASFFLKFLPAFTPMDVLQER